MLAEVALFKLYLCLVALLQLFFFFLFCFSKEVLCRQLMYANWLEIVGFPPDGE